MIRMAVVLPAPFSPKSAKTDPSGTFSVTFLKASVALNRFDSRSS